MEEVTEVSDMYDITGFISNIVHGNGRSAPDRQFYFVNCRPVDIQKLQKLVNEVYHQFNRYQYPFVVLNIKTNLDRVDINVTPNKRQVFVEHEKHLLVIVKASLVSIFEQAGNHDITSATSNSPVLSPFNINSRPATAATSGGNLKAMFGLKQKCSLGASLAKKRSSSSNDQANNKQPKIDSFLHSPNTTTSNGIESPSTNYNHDKTFSNNKSNPEPVLKPNKPTNLNENKPVGGRKTESIFEIDNVEKPTVNKVESREPAEILVVPEKKTESIWTMHRDTVSAKQNDDVITVPDEEGTATGGLSEAGSSSVTPEVPKFDTDIPNAAEANDPDDCLLHRKDDCVAEFSLAKVKEYALKTKQKRDQLRASSLSFSAKIAPNQNKNAESELIKNLNKSSFSKMDVVGQFNLGFIVAKLNSDLFIIDQHASDEIYNFETLQQNSVLQTQNLVCPQKLCLTSSDIIILQENMAIFEKNGFAFQSRDENGKEQLYLTKIPLSGSGNYDFGVADVEELIFMLADAPGTMCRPSKVRSMFASRACRKSVMIGTALSSSRMKRLLDHMSEIERPWNCPHGRPTMRHLIDLSRISNKSLT